MARQIRILELLAPAKNAEVGMAAIDCGADAVYIGAPRFSARSAAGNTIEEIRRLVEYAHQFHAKVYVALNTILKDEELALAKQIIFQLYEIGVDALIVQDMALLEMELPPIALHASTQTDNRTVEKVRFLEKSGFSQVVLARELSLDQIAEIAANCSVPLEVFIHGALCVCYSGQCYLSQYLSGRSANRGECMQACRLPYSLYDANGQLLVQNKHLLSLKDMNRSERLEQLVDAGVSSFKIEGRLKDIAYVKNVTAFYRKELDAIIDRRSDEFCSASDGRTFFDFVPNLQKGFHRDYTSYFLTGKQQDDRMAVFDTPKSKGEFVGCVRQVFSKSMDVDLEVPDLNNGDGLCFINTQGILEGFRLNAVQEDRLFPNMMPNIKAGMLLYRNHDQLFEKRMEKTVSKRLIGLNILLSETESGYRLSAWDGYGNEAMLVFEESHQEAKKPQREGIKQELSKLGGTVFYAQEIRIDTKGERFIPISRLSSWRRSLVDQMIKVRDNSYQRPLKKGGGLERYFTDSLDYRGNVFNGKAELFYQQRGVLSVGAAYEKSAASCAELMRTRYCLRREMGLCLKISSVPAAERKWTLKHGKFCFELDFDCKNCEMILSQQIDS